MKKEDLLHLKGVSVHYGGVKALDKVDVSVRRGEIVALMGPNGAGKSTVLKAAFGLAPLDSGQVLLDGKPFTPVVHEMVRRGVVLVPQGRRVFTHLSIEENLEIGGYFMKDRVETGRRVEEALAFFPALKKKRKLKARALSGGEQQMLAIARGLVAGPRALLLDEPSLGLSPKIIKEVFAKIKEINESQGTSVMVVEHNLKSLLGIVDRAYVLDKGKVVAEETAEGLRTSGILERVFMGKPGN
ncbi:MAG: ABC transporter ATP-binding protein [Deltaproteobacteria bacterium]|nr:ABC transporter ATP-binding protein [Deltaproteobacteria bacterium]